MRPVTIQTRGLAGVWDWVFGLAYMFAFVLITLVKMTYTWLADRESPFLFDEVEMRRFSVREKLDRLRSAGATATAG